MDTEQLELSKDSNFWKLIAKRRQEKTITRAELERRLNEKLNDCTGETPVPQLRYKIKQAPPVVN
ncbi:hypothetical protein NIES2101_25860 [Calothrix sp. HK-06]|nr:hypothetical protein NIES2101_25860 [Calothrix sp. HK-06]